MPAPGVTRSRRIAFSVLEAVRKGDFADRALARFGDDLDPRDHAWVQEVVYGTLRLQGRLDFILTAFVRSGLTELEPAVLDILRLGVYQLREMGGVPAYAAVSQSAELAKEIGAKRAVGLVNGVLQAIRREGDAVVFPSLEADPAGHLTAWGSHPAWLVDRWIRRWGSEATADLVEKNNRRPDLYLRPVGATAAEALAALSGEGVEVSLVAGFPDSLRLGRPGDLGRALELIPAVVQDPAAASVVRFADIPEGSLVLDMAAAPGGKTVGLADADRRVIASDLSFGRMRRVRSNVERAGVGDRVSLIVADGRYPPVRSVDAVLLDAPCTGTGTFRRHADARWRIAPRDLDALTKLQVELLDSAAGIVSPGGILVYSTCSLEPEENELQIANFLARHSEYRLAQPPAGFDPGMTEGDFLMVLPQRQGMDGAFAARLIRN